MALKGQLTVVHNERLLLDAAVKAMCLLIFKCPLVYLQKHILYV